MSIKDAFLKPQNPAQRRYEALRARYVDGMDCRAAAEAFGYSVGSFRNLCSAFRADPGWAFFQPPQRPKEAPPPGIAATRGRRNDRILALRRERQLSTTHT